MPQERKARHGKKGRQKPDRRANHEKMKRRSVRVSKRR